MRDIFPYSQQDAATVNAFNKLHNIELYEMKIVEDDNHQPTYETDVGMTSLPADRPCWEFYDKIGMSRQRNMFFFSVLFIVDSIFILFLRILNIFSNAP